MKTKKLKYFFVHVDLPPFDYGFRLRMPGFIWLKLA